MSKHFSVTRFLSAVLLLDIALIALVSFTGTGVQAFLPRLLPGTFGPGMGSHMTGNHLLGALIVHFDALLFLAAGFVILLNASRHVLMIGAGGISRLLSGTAGLSREDIAATSFAVAEEQKSEILTVHTGRNLVWIGAVLLLLAFPAVCFTWAQADGAGTPLLRDAGGAVANTAVTIEDVGIFAADQLADAVLLDIPRVYKWHATSLAPGDGHAWLKPFVLLYHILSKLIVLATLFAAWRSGHLRAYLLQMAGLDAGPAISMLHEAAVADAPAPPHFDPPPANDHHTPPRTEEPLPPQLEPQPLPLWEHAHEHDEPPALGASILDVPVYVEPAPEPVNEPQAAPLDGEHEEPPPLGASILEVPVYVEPAHAAEPEAATAGQEEPLSLEASILELPADAEPVHSDPAPQEPLSDAPLALHELKTPSDPDPATDSALGEDGDNVHPFPYKNTALHMDPEFDA